MDRLAKKYGVEDPFMWRKVTGKQILAEPGGATLLSRYQGSLLRILSDVYPERKWSVVECLARPNAEYWDSIENRRLFFERAAERLGVKRPEDWKRVSEVEVTRIGGTQLLKRFDGAQNSLLEALRDSFPELDLSLFLSRPQVKSSHWEKHETRRAFMDTLKERYDIHEPSDWRRIALRHVYELPGGRSFIARYNRCILTALRDCYPEEKFFEMECRPRVPNSFWKDVANRRSVLDWIAERRGIRRQEQWRDVSRSTIMEMGAGRLFSYYSTVYSALVDCYPEKQWDIYTSRPKIAGDHWSEVSHIREFLEKVREELLVDDKEDWTRVSRDQLSSLGGAGLSKRMTLNEALRLAYPDEDWSCLNDVTRSKRSTQRLIMVYLRQLLPENVEIIEEFRHKDLGSGSESGREKHALELDFYLPDFQVGIEYNGQQHYHELAFFGPLEQYQRRDREKQQLCDRNGIKLITVPYWWDNSVDSLAATLYLTAPSLFQR